MTATLPYALSCPCCLFFVEVPVVGSDARLSVLLSHILGVHADYDRLEAYVLLMQAYELTAAEAMAR